MRAWLPCCRPHRGATIASPKSGRAVDILTTTPGLRLYMNQRLEAAPGKGGSVYGPHAGITVIAQARTTSVHKPIKASCGDFVGDDVSR